MKNKKICKQISTILLIILLLLITNSEEVNAGLQANKNTQYTKSDLPTNWIKNFREMEKTGQAMGLNEELEEDLTPKDNISNNIDVHMMRSTEYGAIAILSASGYGNPSNEQAITSTTGNETGVMINTNEWEHIAGGLENLIFKGVNFKYYDTYTNSQESARIGDASECDRWHNATYNVWTNDSRFPYFIRGYTGIFSFCHNQINGTGIINQYTGSSYSRGVTVSGIGL